MTTDPHVPHDPTADAPPSDPPPHAIPAESEFAVPPESAVKFTRAAALWSALIVGFLVLILLLVFIMQNTDSTTVHLFGWQWELPVGVAILLAAVCGGLVTVLAGTARIIQLRRAAKKNFKAALK